MAGLKLEGSSYFDGALQKPAPQPGLPDHSAGMGEWLVKPNGRLSEQACIWEFGNIILFEGSAQSIELANIAERLAKTPLTYWCIQIVSDEKDFDQTPAMPPRLMIFDPNDCCYQPVKDKGCCILLFFGHGEPIDRVASVWHQGDKRLDNGLTLLLVDHLRSLLRYLPKLLHEERQNIAEVTRMMALASLGSEFNQKSCQPISPLNGLFEKACHLIGSNLNLRALGPAFLCRSLGVSRSRLYRAFELRGGVWREIQRQRLAKAHEILSNSNNTPAIAQLADELGFGDSSSFSRSFKAEFGYSPSQARSLDEQRPVISRTERA